MALPNTLSPILPPSIGQTAMSSAYKTTTTPQYTGTSLMKTKNRNGPRIEPCGTPAPTSNHRDWEPSETTRNLRLDKNALTHRHARPVIPALCSLNTKPSCQTESNAETISRKA